MNRGFGVLVIVLLIAPAVLGQDVEVTASVDKSTVGVYDQFRFIITVSGKDSGAAETPQLPSLTDLRVVSEPNISTQFQWINGVSSSTKKYIYIILPQKEGQFTIEPVDVRIGSKIFKTEPVQIRVTAASNGSSRDQDASLDPFEDDLSSSRSKSDDVFLVAEIDRKSAYPGQQVTLSYYLYTRVVITGIQIEENPPLTGFWVEDLEVESNPSGFKKTFNGREYTGYVIKRQALFPTTTGNLQIPTSLFAVSARIGGDFYGFSSPSETLYRNVREVKLDVKPLPAVGRPPDFSGAVGSFNLSSSIDKTQVSVGEAVALRIRLEGRGNLKMIPDISLSPIPDFKIYSSKHAENIRPFADNQIGGDKTWEYVIVPSAPGRQSIPSLSFSYFNPAKDQYETVSTSPLSLDVVRGKDSVTSITALSGINKQNLIRLGSDINFIKLSADDLEEKQEPVYKSLWFYLLLGIPLAFNAAVLFYQRERSKQAENLVFIRSRRARRTALKRLKKAEKAGKSEVRRFYDEAAAALSGYLSDKLNLTEIALTSDTLERALTDKSVAPEMVKETTACLQELDFGRFVAPSASSDNMRELAERIRKIIEVLERNT